MIARMARPSVQSLMAFPMTLGTVRKMVYGCWNWWREFKDLRVQQKAQRLERSAICMAGHTGC